MCQTNQALIPIPPRPLRRLRDTEVASAGLTSIGVLEMEIADWPTDTA